MKKRLSKVTSPDKSTISSNLSETKVSPSNIDQNVCSRLWKSSSSTAAPIQPTTVTSNIKVPKKSRLREKGDCNESTSSSHTQYFKQNRYAPEVYEKINPSQYLGMSPSISGTSNSFHCVHHEGRVYDEKTRLKRYQLKDLDPIRMSEYWLFKTICFICSIFYATEFNCRHNLLRESRRYKLECSL